MAGLNDGGYVSAVFITFPGNCRAALTHYQTCFGGTLQFDAFEKELDGYEEKPVISGALLSDGITIHGSDLVHDEGRTLGNYVSIFVRCRNAGDRQALVSKLRSDKTDPFGKDVEAATLIEVTDAFDVRWVLSI